MRLGIAGVGRIGAFHAATLAALPGVDSLAVAEACELSRREGRPVPVAEVRR